MEKYGYPCEIHNVITEDGYILTLHRIPSNKGKRSKSVPILLQHGFSASSADWVIPGPRRGIGMTNISKKIIFLLIFFSFILYGIKNGKLNIAFRKPIRCLFKNNITKIS